MDRTFNKKYRMNIRGNLGENRSELERESLRLLFTKRVMINTGIKICTEN